MYPLSELDSEYKRDTIFSKKHNPSDYSLSNTTFQVLQDVSIANLLFEPPHARSQGGNMGGRIKFLCKLLKKPVSVLLLAVACSATPTALYTHGAVVAAPAVKGHAYSTEIHHGTSLVKAPVALHAAPLLAAPIAHHAAVVPAAPALAYSKTYHAAPALAYSKTYHAAPALAYSKTYHAAPAVVAAPIAHATTYTHHAAPVYAAAPVHHAAPVYAAAPVHHATPVLAAAPIHHAAPIAIAAPAHHYAVNYKGSALIH
ncbi:hypothetical protein TNIN_157231 [Trichonephila inaurata madagascariensis]|uniref:Uncharacterized protein n=1 Tax=Trichonephila inaurata madagascariensis TaxID=2747483 RepID=A0A8X7CFZ8_9ARAC|nr:hypothetical protein TNIN_157231 [Trichonephila inaurata madagascariensis]